MKNSSDTIGNGTRDLPARSAVPQLTSPPRAPSAMLNHKKCAKGLVVYCALDQGSFIA